MVNQDAVVTWAKLIDWIHEGLKREGWSLRKLGERSGISHSLISLVLSGQQPPSPDFCIAIAQGFGVPAEIPLQKAGFLVAKEDDAEYWQELRHYLRQLSIRDRIRVIQMVKGWAAEAELEEGGH